MVLDPHLLNYRQCLAIVNSQIHQLERSPLAPIPPSLEKHITPSAWAFLTYAAKTLYMHAGFDTATFETWLTEGFDDVSIDLLQTCVVDSALSIGIIQCKYRETVSGTHIAALGSSLEYVFEANESTVRQLTNPALVRRILDVRAAMKIADTITVEVAYVTRGKTKNLPAQVDREINRLRDKLKAGGRFVNVVVRPIGPQELVAASISNTFSVPELSLSLSYVQGPNASIRYTVAHGSLQTKAVVCTVTAQAFGGFVQGNENWLFRENVRDFLGSHENRVNRAIAATATDKDKAGLFWLLNNGITITCARIVDRQDPDAPTLSLLKPQIVNGCQTSEVLAAALAQCSLQAQAHLLVKILETEDDTLIDEITIATNSQTAIRKRDLHSNDSTQRALTIAFESMGLIYQTKPGQLRSARGQKHKLVSSEKCGQASLAVLAKSPSHAMSQKSRIWEDERPGYHEIFDHPASEMLYAYRLVEYCERRRKELTRTLPERSERVRDYVIRFGVFHLASILSFVLLSGRLAVSVPESQLGALTKEAESDSPKILWSYNHARKILLQVITDFRRQSKLKLLSCFKSESINDAIAKALYSLPIDEKRSVRRRQLRRSD